MSNSHFSRAALVLALALCATSAAAQTPVGGDTAGGVVKPSMPTTGAEIYRNVCQACHMADAKGATGAGVIPALAGNPKLAVAAYPIAIVSKGMGGMPGLTAFLSDAQIAEVVGYVRTNFGNHYDKPVTAAEVSRITGR